MKLYAQEDIDKILGMMRHHDELLTSYIEKTTLFEHYNRFLSRQRKPLLSSPEFIEEVIRYLMVSNKIAYASQFDGITNLFDIDIEYFGVKPLECSTRDLFLELSKLSATTRTAATNYFLDKRWHEVLREMQMTLLCSSLGDY